MTPRRTWVAIGAVGIAGAAAVGAVAVSGGGTDDQSVAATSATATTKIVVQDLEERETVDGTLGYSDARPVVNRLAGTVTWTPRLGSVVDVNHTLYEVDGESVYLLSGAYPAYRTLQPGLTGKDVLALERNLRALGLDGGRDMAVDGSWDAGTTAAVRRWQSRKGLDETGKIEKGRIVFQPGARRIADVAIAAGQSASGSGGGGGASNAPASAEEGVTMVFASARAQTTPAPTDDLEGTTPATTPTPTTPRAQTPQTSTARPPAAAPRASGAGAAPAGAQGGAPSAGGGASGASGGSTGAATTSADVSAIVMTTTSTKRIVAVDLEATKQALAKRGARVSVEMPSGKDVQGTIATVGAVASQKATAGDDDPPATVKLVIKLKSSAGTGLDQAPVDVRLTQSRARNVMTVPVTALIAQQGGKFAVEVRDGGRREIVEVTTGLYTDSYVEIEGEGLRAGMTVTNSRV